MAGRRNDGSDFVVYGELVDKGRSSRATASGSAQRSGAQRSTAQGSATQRSAAQRSAAQPSAAQRSAAQRSAAQRSAAQRSAAQPSAAQRSAAQSSAAQRSAAQRSAAQRSAAQRSAAQPSAAQRNAAQRSAAQRSAAQRSAAQRSAAQRSAAQPSAAQRNAAQRSAPQRSAAQPTTAQRAAAQRSRHASTQTITTPQRARSTAGTASAQNTTGRSSASTQQRARRTKTNASNKNKRTATKRTANRKASRATQQQSMQRPSAAAVNHVSAGAAIEASKAARKQNRIRNKQATKGMSLGQKAGYYASQIGPTVRSIQASPERSKMAYYIIVLIIALLFAIYLTSLCNDVMGFTRSSDPITITVSQDMTTNQLIKELDKQGAIKHAGFCKLFIALANKVDNDMFANPTYLKGEYTVTANMGIEKMLITCMNVQKQESVEVLIPEGYTVEQIAARLEENKVCSQKDFIAACNSTDYDFDFVKTLAADKETSSRYHALEGYLYPDTYEFYVGESASSVVKKMLQNTSDKWTEAYKQRAEQINMSMDDILTMAAIIQKEDSNADNMAVIASVFYNRINSSTFPSLQSDATNVYVNTYIKPNVSTSEYETYYSLYSTYQCEGLPVGPICSPGSDAIKAALWPESTNYYFFAHDDDGNLYTARTASEQNANVYKALNSSNG